MRSGSGNNRSLSKRRKSKTPSKQGNTYKKQSGSNSINNSMVVASEPTMAQLNNSMNQSRTEFTGGKTTTNKRQVDSKLKLINTDGQTQSAIPQPLLSQQHKHSNSKLERLKEKLQTNK